MWGKITKIIVYNINFILFLQNLTEKVIQVIDILINFAAKSI